MSDTFERKVIIGDKTHAFMAIVGNEAGMEAALARAVRKALPTGRRIVHDDGRVEWVIHEVAQVDGARGRIRINRTHVRISPEGVRSEEKLGPVFRGYGRAAGYLARPR